MLFLFLIIYLVLITPVKLGAAVSVGGGPAGAAVGVMVWGFRRVVRIRVRRRDGVPRLCADVGGRSVILSPQMENGWSTRMARMLLRSLTGGGDCPRVLRLRALDGLIRIGGRDAGSIALLTGGLRALTALLPHSRIRCVPSFGGPSLLRLRCIAQARLGTILAAGLKTALRMRRTDRKEEGPWIIPSDS